MIVLNWYGCQGGCFKGCVYSGGGLPCVGEFHVIMCGNVLNGVGIHLYIVDYLHDVVKRLIYLLRDKFQIGDMSRLRMWLMW